MRHAKAIAFAVVLSVCSFWHIPAAAATRLPAHLPKTTCHRLLDMHGKEKWKHYLWHIAGKDYIRISQVIQRESGWNPHAVNPASRASGLPQFTPTWWNRLWVFDPTAPILSLRVMVYVWQHPSFGGSKNWALTL